MEHDCQACVKVVEPFLACKSATKEQAKANSNQLASFSSQVNPIPTMIQHSDPNREIRSPGSQPAVDISRYSTQIIQNYSQLNNDTSPSLLSQNWLSKKQVETEKFVVDNSQPTLDNMSHTQFHAEFYPDPYPTNVYPKMSTMAGLSYSSTPTSRTILNSTMDASVQTDPVLLMDANTWLSWLSPETLDQWMQVCLDDPSFIQIVNHIENHFIYRSSNPM